MTRSDQRDARGLRGGWADFQQLRFLEPSRALAPFVEQYWAVTWDLRGQAPYRQPIVPYPNVHLTFVNGVARVYGVARSHVVRELAGLGWVFGVAFRPGGFRPFLGGPVSSLTDRWVPAHDVFDAPIPETELARTTDEDARHRIVEHFLHTRLPTRDPVAERMADVVARIAGDSAVTRVDGLAADLGVSTRQLQRRFADYVGVSPKWVIRRYRLHEITERMAQGHRIDWGRLAAELGYADQAHLSRDFASIVGEPPSLYAQRYPDAR